MLGENLNGMEELPYDVEIVAMNLNVPWAIDISEDGRLYVTERIGRIWILQDGKFLPEPLITFEPPFISQEEGGLMGLVLDPDFLTNHYIYVMYSYIEEGRMYNRVVRLLEQDNKASIDRILIDQIPGGRTHNGGRLKIGPDQKLYVTTGDAGTGSLAQDLDSLAGKILRINLDGSIPEDNPFVNSPVYSYGHRNPQGLAWNSDQVLFASEHGQTAHDEINIIIPGGNYGWPVVQGDESTNQFITQKPLIQSGNRTWAPAGIVFVSNGIWDGRLLVACLRAEQLLSMVLNDNNEAVIGLSTWLVNQFGRLREAYQARDGSVYLTTSNRDRRRIPNNEDDKIIRLIPRA
ncbi:MAG TPA: PQQ-dependent sugar dehydrogenase [Clostridiales bacterium]|nr:PQQ-dependent sugar dehydrogenase [Clostridiales bacterium]